MSAQVNDLAAFLRARLDEDEAKGREDVNMGWARPRVLREVAAKRAIVEHGESHHWDWLLGTLAAVYSDHSDYDPRWVAGVGDAGA